MGFTAGGVLAGSFAACRQSQLGLIPVRSCFSICQSIAMGSLNVYVIPGLVALGFLVGVVSYIYISR